MTFKILKKKNSELFGRIVTQDLPPYLLDTVIPVLYDKDTTVKDIEERYGIYIRDYDLVAVDLLTISM